MLRRSIRTVIAAGLLLTALSSSANVYAADPGRPAGEPGWAHGVVRVGEDRDAIKSMPVTERPYRPLHFYGNTIRRKHYRGTAIPAPRDVIGAGAATVLRK